MKSMIQSRSIRIRVWVGGIEVEIILSEADNLSKKVHIPCNNYNKYVTLYGVDLNYRQHWLSKYICIYLRTCSFLQREQDASICVCIFSDEYNSFVFFSVFCSICLQSGNTNPKIAKWPSYFEDIFIYQMPRIIALGTLVGEYWQYLSHIHICHIYTIYEMKTICIHKTGI